MLSAELGRSTILHTKRRPDGCDVTGDACRKIAIPNPQSQPPIDG